MAKTKKSRFLFIDGLRGVAAMMVVLYHFSLTLDETATDWAWPLLETFFSYGYLGVDIFFVISGFVISYSVSRAEHTPGFLFRFGLRRSLRLDPPYWIAIIAELTLIQLGLMYIPGVNTQMPAIDKILAHLIYMQNILGYGDIVGVFWTLCYEIQFYLVFVGMLVIARWVRLGLGASVAGNLLLVVAAASYLWSLGIFFGPVPEPLHGLFINRWFQFFLGFLAMRSVRANRLSPQFMLASALLLGACILYPEQRADNGLIALVFAWLIVIAGLRDKMTIWLSNRAVQFLGLTSYSLYLVHQIIAYRFVKVLHLANGEDFTPLLAWMVFFAGVFVSVVSGWIMYRLIEAPSLRVCHQIRMDQHLSLRSFIGSFAALKRKVPETG